VGVVLVTKEFTMNQLIESLRKRREEPTSLMQERLECKKAVERLYERLEGWLRPATEAGALSVSRAAGNGSALPNLVISDGLTVVQVSPGASFPEGKSVLMRGRGPQYILDREDGRWQVSFLPAGEVDWVTRELTEPVFCEVLAELLLDG